jgi:hypothetical protein
MQQVNFKNKQGIPCVAHKNYFTIHTCTLNVVNAVCINHMQSRVTKELALWTSFQMVIPFAVPFFCIHKCKCVTDIIAIHSFIQYSV